MSCVSHVTVSTSKGDLPLDVGWLFSQTSVYFICLFMCFNPDAMFCSLRGIARTTKR